MCLDVSGLPEWELVGRIALLCVSATGSINFHVEHQQMLQSPSNAHSSSPLYSHLLTLYHLLPIAHIPLSCSLPSASLNEDYPPYLLYPTHSVFLSLNHLLFLYSVRMLSPVLFFLHLWHAFFYSPSLFIMQDAC